MDRFLKPERLETLPNATSSTRIFNHWFRTFSALMRRTEIQEDLDRLDLLITYISPDIYEYIAEQTTYDSAVNRLRELYIKPTNEVFARHVLSTRVQKEEENIDEYIQELLLLAKECNFKAVDAVQNRDDSVRDAFITGLRSNTIRQRLLEKRTLDLNTAIDQARALDTAQKNSESYSRPFPPVGAATTENNDVSEIESCAAVPKTKSRCYFCNGPRHDRQYCPARETTCRRCNKVGHFSKVCRSRPTFTSASTHSSTDSPKLATIMNNTMCTPETIISNSTVASSSSSQQATIYVLIEENEATALMDTDSCGSFISLDYVRKYKLKINPASGTVSMASSSLNVPVKGRCSINLNLLGEFYPNTPLSVLPNLCCDVILGQDFMKQHEHI